jgi:hypothetical protein
LRVGLSAEGAAVIAKCLESFRDDTEICTSALHILKRCLQELPDAQIATSIAKVSGILQSVDRFLNDDRWADSLKLNALLLLSSLSAFPEVHESLIAAQVLQTLTVQLSKHVQRTPAEMTDSHFSMIAIQFHVLADFCGNSAAEGELERLQVLSKMKAVFQKFRELNYLAELFVVSLRKVASSFEGLGFLKRADLDLTDICKFGLASCNQQMMEDISCLVDSLLGTQEISALIEGVMTGQQDAQDLIMFSFLSVANSTVDSLKSTQLVDRVLEFLKRDKLSLAERLAAVGSLNIIVARNEGIAKHFDKVSGLDAVLKSVAQEDSLLAWNKVSALLSTLCQTMDAEFLQSLPKRPILNTLVQKFERLTQTLETCTAKRMTAEKARRSVSFHQGEVGRTVMTTVRGVSEENVVEAKIALNFLALEDFSTELFSLVALLNRNAKDSPFTYGRSFLSNAQLLMSLFSQSESFHLGLFEMMSVTPMKREMFDLFCLQQWPMNCLKALTANPLWKRVGLFVLRLLDSLLADEKYVKGLVGNLVLIRLVSFTRSMMVGVRMEGGDKEGVEEVGGKTNRPGGVGDASPAEVQEVYRQSTKLVERLLDKTTLAVFCSDVDRKVATLRPKQEALDDLVMDLAVLSCANSSTVLGPFNLKNKLHLRLKAIADNVRKTAQSQLMVQKHRLVGEAIRAVANFVWTTLADKDSEQYEQKEWSVVLLKLMTDSLKDAIGPKEAMFALLAFREFLASRLRVLQSGSSEKPQWRHSHDLFLLVPEKLVPEVMAEVLDALGQNHHRFYRDGGVVTLNFEVMSLMCQLSPLWKAKLTLPVLSQLMEVISGDSYSSSCEMQAVELLRRVTGTDDESEEGNAKALRTTLAIDGLNQLFFSIRKSGFDEVYVAACKPLLEGLVMEDSEESNMEAKTSIEHLLASIDSSIDSCANALPNSDQLSRMANVLSQLISFSLIDVLNGFLMANKLSQRLNRLWQLVERLLSSPADVKALSTLHEIDVLCAFGVQNAIKQDEQKWVEEDCGSEQCAMDLFGATFKCLERHQRSAEVSLVCACILNSGFSSPVGQLCAQLSQDSVKLALVEKAVKVHLKSNNRTLARELQDLLKNMSGRRDMTEEGVAVKECLRELEAGLRHDNMRKVEASVWTIERTLSRDYVLPQEQAAHLAKALVALMAHLKASFESHFGCSCRSVVMRMLADKAVPVFQKTTLQALSIEVGLSKGLVSILSGASQELMTQLASSKGLSEMVEVPLTLNLQMGSLKAIARLSESLRPNDTLDHFFFEIGTLVLMNCNKDSFRQTDPVHDDPLRMSGKVIQRQQNVSEITISVNAIVRNEDNQYWNESEIRPSTRPADLILKTKAQLVSENAGQFHEALYRLVKETKAASIVQQYLADLKAFRPSEEQTVCALVASSRSFTALLRIVNPAFDPLLTSSDFANGFAEFFILAASTVVPSKKLVRLAEDIVGLMGRRLVDRRHDLRSAKLWNAQLHFYFVAHPDFLRLNSKRVMANLVITKPRLSTGKYVQLKLNTNTDRLCFELDFPKINVLSSRNQLRIDSLFSNIGSALTQGRLSVGQFFSLVEGVTRSKTGASKLQENQLLAVIEGLVNDFSDFNDSQAFTEMTAVVLNCAHCGVANENVQVNLRKKSLAKCLTVKAVQAVEKGHKQLLHRASQVMSMLFHNLDDHSVFYEGSVVEKLMGEIGVLDSWGEEWEHLYVLFGMMSAYDGLERRLSAIGFYKLAKQYLDRETVAKKINLPEHSAEGLTVVSLSSSKGIRCVQVVAYSLAEWLRHFGNFNAEERFEALTFMFRLFKGFQRCTADFVLCLKTIQSLKQCVKSLRKEDWDRLSEKLEGMKSAFGEEMRKHSASPKLLHEVQEVCELLQQPAWVSAKEAVMQLNSSWPSVNNQTGTQLAIGEDVNDVLATPESNSTSLTVVEAQQQLQSVLAELGSHELTRRDKSNLLRCFESVVVELNSANSSALLSMNSLGIPLLLRELANRGKLEVEHRIDSLDLLLKFIKSDFVNSTMAKNESYLRLSADNLCNALPRESNAFKVKSKLKALIDLELEFMMTLVQTNAGSAQFHSDRDLSTEVTARLLHLVMSIDKLMPTRVFCLEILNQLMRVEVPTDLETLLLIHQKSLFEDNLDEPSVLENLMKAFESLAKGSAKTKANLVADGLLVSLKRVADGHVYNDLTNLAMLSLVLTLVTDCPETHSQLLDSPLLLFFATLLNNNRSPRMQFLSLAKLVLQLGFGNNEAKNRMVSVGMTTGLVSSFEFFTLTEAREVEIPSYLLKCMANFATTQMGCEHLIKKRAVRVLDEFFRRAGDRPAELVRLTMVVMANLSLVNKKNVVRAIVEEGGVQLVLACMRVAEETRDEGLMESCIDCLGQMSIDDSILALIEASECLDIQLDLVRQRISSTVMSKAVGCMSQFCRSQSFALKVYQKGGHSVVAEIVRTNPKDQSLCYVSIRFLRAMVAFQPEQLLRFSQSGIPEKLIGSLTETLPLINKRRSVQSRSGGVGTDSTARREQRTDLPNSCSFDRQVLPGTPRETRRCRSCNGRLSRNCLPRAVTTWWSFASSLTWQLISWSVSCSSATKGRGGL